MFTKIIVGTDGSHAANRALVAACGLTRATGAELTVVHAPTPDPMTFATGAMAGYAVVSAPPDNAKIIAEAEVVIEAARELAAENGVTLKHADVRLGDAGDQILAAAKEYEADLIVTGRRGRSGIASLLLGSTSQRITHNATCAVLTVP